MNGRTEYEATEAIRHAAESTAEQLLAEGCESAEYRPILRGDLDGLAEDLGRKPTADEVVRFEAAVQERLQVALAAEACRT